MSYFDYQVSLEISKNDPPFDAIIMAAIRKADSFNVEKLRDQWPEIYLELLHRYNAPGGVLDGEDVPW